MIHGEEAIAAAAHAGPVKNLISPTLRLISFNMSADFYIEPDLKCVIIRHTGLMTTDEIPNQLQEFINHPGKPSA